jgi:hypothetical protein
MRELETSSAVNGWFVDLEEVELHDFSVETL